MEKETINKTNVLKMQEENRRLFVREELARLESICLDLKLLELCSKVEKGSFLIPRKYTKLSLSEEIGKLNNEKNEIMYFVDMLPIECKTVVVMRYVDRKTWNKISDIMRYSRRAIFNKFEKALQLLEEKMFLSIEK